MGLFNHQGRDMVVMLIPDPNFLWILIPNVWPKICLPLWQYFFHDPDQAAVISTKQQ